MFRPRAKALPTLTEYLNFLVRRNDELVALKVASYVAGTGIAAMLLGAFLRDFRGASLAISTAVPAVLFLGALIPTGIQFFRGRSKAGADRRAQTRHEAIAIGRQMLASKRLHRDLDAASAQLLEESARFWREIKAELDSPFWRNPDLPSHWKSVREQTSAATDEAMEEMLILLRSSYHPTYQPAGWENVVEDAIETFVTGPKLRKGEGIPPGFHEARQIAEKLKLAAGQVRSAASELTSETSSSSAFKSAAALDLAIGDMRSLKEAEQELRRNLNA